MFFIRHSQRTRTAWHDAARPTRALASQSGTQVAQVRLTTSTFSSVSASSKVGTRRERSEIILIDKDSAKKIPNATGVNPKTGTSTTVLLPKQGPFPEEGPKRGTWKTRNRRGVIGWRIQERKGSRRIQERTGSRKIPSRTKFLLRQADKGFLLSLSD